MQSFYSNDKDHDDNDVLGEDESDIDKRAKFNILNENFPKGNSSIIQNQHAAALPLSSSSLDLDDFNHQSDSQIHNEQIHQYLNELQGSEERTSSSNPNSAFNTLLSTILSQNTQGNFPKSITDCKSESERAEGPNDLTPLISADLMKILGNSIQNPSQHLKTPLNPPPPPGFELPTVQHRLDPRWQLCWFKSIDHYQNRRRYTAKCICCGYELEGRPERMARHILSNCIKVSPELKREYREELEKTGKLYNTPSGGIALQPNPLPVSKDVSREAESSERKRKRSSSPEQFPLHKSRDSEGSLLSSLLHEERDRSRLEELLVELVLEGSLPSLSLLDFSAERPPSSLEILLASSQARCPSTLSLLPLGPRLHSEALQELLRGLAGPSPLPGYSSLLLKTLPGIERKSLSSLLPFLSGEGKESRSWTVSLPSQQLLDGSLQFFIVLQQAELDLCLGCFKLPLNLPRGLEVLDQVYSSLWTRIDSLSIPRQLIAFSLPLSLTLTSVSLSSSSSAAVKSPDPLLAAAASADLALPSSLLLVQRQGHQGEEEEEEQPPPPPPLVSSKLQQYHFVAVDLRDSDSRIISIPCVAAALQSLLRYFAPIVSPLNLLQELCRYFLYHPLWLSALQQLLLLRRPDSQLPVFPDTSQSFSPFFSLFHHFEAMHCYLSAMRDLLLNPSELQFLNLGHLMLPPLPADLLDLLVNSPHYFLALSAYLKVLRPVAEGLEQLVLEQSAVTLAHVVKTLLSVESGLSRLSLPPDSYANNLRSAVLARLRESLVVYDVDLFVVALFLWPRYKNLAMSRKYDYNAIRQGILRLANVLKCFAIDQAYQLVHEIEMYRTNASPFCFSEEQLDLHARELWDCFPDKANVLCIIARKLFSIAAISLSGAETIHRYNRLLSLHSFDEPLAEKLLVLSSLLLSHRKDQSHRSSASVRLPVEVSSLAQASRSVESISFTWIETEVRNIQLLQERERQEAASGFRSHRSLSLDEIFDFSVFLQIEAIVKARQESIAMREREAKSVSQYEWDPASVLADYEGRKIP